MDVLYLSALLTFCFCFLFSFCFLVTMETESSKFLPCFLNKLLQKNLPYAFWEQWKYRNPQADTVWHLDNSHTWWGQKGMGMHKTLCCKQMVVYMENNLFKNCKGRWLLLKGALGGFFLQHTHTKITLLIIKHLTILTLKFEQDHLGGTLRKHVFSHMWTAKVQISLCICTVWSGPSLCTYRIIGYYRIYEWRANAQGWIWICIFCAWCGPFNYLEVCLKMPRWGLYCLFGHVCSDI